MTDAQIHSDDATEAARLAQEKIEVARHAQITEIVDGAIKPIREEQARVRVVLEEANGKMQKAVENLASKQDIKEIKEFMNNVDLTFKVIRSTGKYSKTFILTIASVIVAFAVITGGLKALLAAIATWAIGKPI